MAMSILPVLSAAAAAGESPPAWLQFAPLIAMAAVMWFLFLRPQMRAQKEQKAKLDGIKKGDAVLTGGGLLAKVVKVDDVYVELELGANMRVKALKSTIADVIPPAGSAAAND